MNKTTVTKNIPEKKIKRVSEIVDTINDKKTILLASIKNIPGSQYQEIVKKLRGKAIVKFPKKSILFRAIDDSGVDTVKKIKDHVKESTAVIFSDIDSFELAAELLKNKTPARAKTGQIAPKDIQISEGPTDLPPGPAISELGAVGIPIQIEKGKIHIKKSTIIVKKGEKISSAAADVMNKLDMKPFTVGFTPLAVLDKEKGKIYLDINIDSEKAIEDLKYAFGRALPFAVEIGYYNEDTIKFVIGKAGSHGKALEKLSGSSEEEEKESKDKKDDADGKEKKEESEKKELEKSETEESKDENNEESKNQDQNKSKEEK
ncbi:MAG: 50S ribosomal protein L10 [Candidatus Pacearchaeota archaeon]